MNYDVFLSHSSRDVAHRQRLQRLLVQQLGLSVFVDDKDIVPGEPFEAVIRAAIEASAMTLLVLTEHTRAAPWVPFEVKESQRLGLRMIGVVFDKAGEDHARAEPGLADLSFLDARGIDDSELLARLWRCLYQRLVNVEVHRGHAREWALARVPAAKADFWRGADRRVFGDDLTPVDGLVVVGPGGAGKSVLLARHVLRLLERRDTVPLIVDASVMPAGPSRSQTRPADLARAILGAKGNISPEDHVRHLEEGLGKHVVFVVDAIDNMIAGDAYEVALELLRILDAAGVVIGTCRLEAWTNRVDRLHLTRRDMPRVPADVIEALSPVPHDLLTRIPAFRLPVYLDLAMRHGTPWASLVTSVTDFLRKLERRLATRRATGRDEPTDTKQRLLRALAELQLERGRYATPRALVAQRCAGCTDLAAAIADLREDGLLVEGDQGATLRRSHDLLDAFGMAAVLLESRSRRSRLYGDAAHEVGHGALAALVRVAKDDADDALLFEVLDELAGMQDRKEWSDPHMDRAWSASYAFREVIVDVPAEVADCLGGSLALPVERHNVDEPDVGTRFRAPRCTVACASTLGDAIATLPEGIAPMPERVIPVLARGLEQYKLRGRLIEALAHYGTREAMEAVKTAGERACAEDGDRGALIYVARALRHYDRSAVPLLRRIATLPDAKKMTRREAVLAARELSPVDARDLELPELTDADLVAALVTRNPDGTHSDWRLMVEHLRLIETAARTRQAIAPEVCEAVRVARGHKHTPVQALAVRVLAAIDDLAMIPAVLGMMVDDHVSNDVLSAIRASVDEMIQRWTPDPAAAPRREIDARLHTLDVLLEIAERWTATHGRELLTAVVRGMRAAIAQGPWLVDDDAAELPCGPGSLSSRLDDDARVSAVLDALVTAEDRAAAGEGYEAKLRVATVCAQRGLVLAPSRWEDGRSFHVAVGRMYAHGSREMFETLLGAVAGTLAGSVPFPGLASVHAIVVTADDQVLWTRRSETVAYAPGAWSASYEEQLQAGDATGGRDPIAAAAARGFAEELGLTLADGDAITTIAPIIELGVLNVAVVVLVRTAHTSEEIGASWPRARDHWESQAVFFTPRGALGGDGGTPPDAVLHPTAPLRTRLLRRLFG